MQVWIKSQEGEGFSKVDEVEYQNTGRHDCVGATFEEGHFIIACNASYRGFELGKYETKERALEVIDQIWNKIKNSQRLFVKDIGLKMMKQKDLEQTQKYIEENSVIPLGVKLERIDMDVFFEMPKE